ncbi:hypothetical protein DYB26_012937 [Aphanomyces astaci]|uniref:EXPERA domain-containing protein n=1 Tax=Aphanomyces astaci TaxID=112090 RepID=A0A418E7E2_APHAT|nr:hypothetical protein DYB26_012937 [Aphanomyces astaci]
MAGGQSIGSDWFYVAWCALSLLLAVLCDSEALLHDPATYGKRSLLELVITCVYPGSEWLRVPTLVYAAQSITVMAIVLTEQFVGEFKTSTPLVILGSYLPFAIVPFFFLIRASGPTMFGKPLKSKNA